LCVDEDDESSSSSDDDEDDDDDDDLKGSLSQGLAMRSSMAVHNVAISSFTWSRALFRAATSMRHLTYGS